MDVNDVSTRRFAIEDYAVFAVTLAVSAAIGIYYACTGDKQSTTKEFLFGGKTMKVLPVSLSVLATFLSAITLLGVPAETYQYGLQYWIVVVSYCFALPVTAFLFVPVFYEMQVSSIYEYLEIRFNKSARTVAFGISTVAQLIYMAFVIYAPSLVLSQVSGMDLWLSVLSIGIVCTFYTTIGGIKAVVWTDVFQTTVIVGAMLTVLIKGTIAAGGLEDVWLKAKTSMRTEFFNMDPDPTVRHTFWSLTIGGFFTWVCIYAVNQSMIQRSLTLPTLSGAKAVVWLNVPSHIITITITCLAGLVIYANYSTCDPIKTRQISTPNQILPLFVMDTLGFLPGLPGLFAAGIFSGSLSTLSSCLNSLAAVTLEDFVKAFIAPKMTDIWATRTAKLLALGYGVVAIVLVAIVQNFKGTVIQSALSVSGTFNGPLLGLFVLGMFFPWPNAKGALVGFFTGLAICLWICIGGIYHKVLPVTAPLSVESCIELYNNATGGNNTLLSTLPTSLKSNNDQIFWLYRLSYLWYSAIGCIISVVVGLTASFLFGSTPKESIEPSVMCSVFYKLWNCSKKGEKGMIDKHDPELERPKILCTNGSSLLKLSNVNHFVYPAMDDKCKNKVPTVSDCL